MGVEDPQGCTVLADTTITRTVLVIDDDKRLCETLIDVFADERTFVVTAQTCEAGLGHCRSRQIDVVLLDQNLPDGAGVDLCPKILDLNDRTKIVFMTAYPTFDNAVAALKTGASDYLTKPFELEELELAVTNAFRIIELESIELLHDRGREKEIQSANIIGADGGLRDTVHLARLAAASSAPVLITGETGTGKSLLAKHIHYSGQRASRPFVSVNCAALPDSLAESELFGHERGAFTGATGLRRGVFEMAEDGTVFLDEIGAMPINLQAKFLGVLEDLTLRRIGGEIVRQVRARIIAATNLDLDAAVSEGQFRADLFFRLGVLKIHIPALRERLQDLPHLCRFLTHSISGSNVEISSAELGSLRTYHWPGNVRELRNVLERSLIIQDSDSVEPSKLLGDLAGATHQGESTPAEKIVPLAELERVAISRALDHFNGNLTRTARALGIALSTLKRKVQTMRS